MAHGRFPALLWPLFLHGGQVTSQCHSPEEHHAGQPARPQSSALRAGATGLWVPQEGPREPGRGGGGGKGRGCILLEEVQGGAAWGKPWPKTLLSQKEWDKMSEKTTTGLSLV